MFRVQLIHTRMYKMELATSYPKARQLHFRLLNLLPYANYCYWEVSLGVIAPNILSVCVLLGWVYK